MVASNRHVWIRAAILVGIVYLVIGRLFATNHELFRSWRAAAWVISAIAYGVHIWYEHFRLRSAPRVLGGHVALGVAIGAFGIAVAGMLNSVSSGAGLRATWLIALLAFPALTAIPAFLVAVGVASMLPRAHPPI
jgi:hypothetical protein